MNDHRFQTTPKIPSGDALNEFMLLNGRYSNFTKETFFLRYASGQNWDADTARLQTWAGQEGTVGRVFAPALSSYLPAPQVEKYAALCSSGRISFPFRFANSIWQDSLERGYDQIAGLFQRTRGRHEAAIMRNFSVKILCWIDTYFPQLFVETWKMNRFPKFACGGKLKLTEYLFLYLLFLLGCDVLYISPTGEAAVESQELLALSSLVQPPSPGPHPIGNQAVSPDRLRRSGAHPPAACPTAAPPPAQPAATPASGRPVSVTLPPRPAAASAPGRPVSVTLPPRPAAASASGRPAAVTLPPRPAAASASGRPAAVTLPPRPVAASASGRPAPPAPPDRSAQPLEFEELAKRAASVVMLKVFDKGGQCFKGGSGVIISDKGYVLTNLHVVSGGNHFGILLEDEENISYTDELIKYHPDFDLAILRIEKCRTPIPLYCRSKALVRGQKVVAIGSPLGLFNTVSDGIISGFRELEKVSMIQFTAPVSHGSSGGALLDLCGNLIGLITGGYDEGQNLNLAVGYQSIRQFAGGLLA